MYLFSSFKLRVAKSLSMLCLVTAVSACELWQTKKSDQHGAITPSSVIGNSVFIDRTGNGDSAEIRFQTKANVLCRLALIPQDSAKAPSTVAPMVFACSNPNSPRQAFLEKVSGLRQDALYLINLYTWTPPQSESEASLVVIKETADSASMIRGDESAVISELLVGRLDIPLMSAEVFRHKLNQPSLATNIKTQLSIPLGCQQGVSSPSQNLREADPVIGIQQLITRDFATASAVASQDHPERMQITYNNLNSGLNQWTLSYQSNGKNSDVTIEPVNQFVSFEMESSNIVSFDSPQLTKAPDSALIDPNKPLKFSWTIANTLLDPSYLVVQIGNPASPNSIYCAFNANQGFGSVDSTFLQNLDDGQLDLQARLITNQLFVKEGWLINVIDWRYGRVSK